MNIARKIEPGQRAPRIFSLDEALRLAALERPVEPSAQAESSSTRPGTVAELLRAAMEILSTRVQRSTLRAMRNHVNMFTRLWGTRRVESIEVRDFYEFIQARRLTASNSTIRHELALMSSVYGVGVEAGWVPANPLASVKKTKLTINRRTQWLPEEDEERLERAYMAFENWASKDQGVGLERAKLEWSAVRFAILTGVRRGEMLALRTDSLGRDTLGLPAGKTGPRSVPLHPLAREIAEQWLSVGELSRSRNRYIFWPWSDARGAFERQRWAERMVYGKQFRPIANSVGFRHLTWHDLRRTFACRLLARGVGVFEVMKLLGHSNPQQTMTYCQVGFDQLAASVAKLV